MISIFTVITAMHLHWGVSPFLFAYLLIYVLTQCNRINFAIYFLPFYFKYQNVHMSIICFQTIKYIWSSGYSKLKLENADPYSIKKYLITDPCYFSCNGVNISCNHSDNKKVNIKDVNFYSTGKSYSRCHSTHFDIFKFLINWVKMLILILT